MGQAKQRGTYEERQAKAISRNNELAKHILENPRLAHARRRMALIGIRRMATELTAAGILKVT